MRLFKTLAFVIVLTSLFVPVAQRVFNLSQPRLKGVYTITEKPTFSLQSWLAGDWQQQFSDYYETHVGFRPWFVQLKNHIEYHAFRIVPGAIVVGKNDYLFDNVYVDSYLGKDRMPFDTALAQVEKLQFIEQYLARHNQHIYVIMAPSKARFYAEYLPDNVHPELRNVSNYDQYRLLLSKSKVPFIDFTRYFLSIKDTSTKLLYTKFGIHWSVYSSHYVTDSIVRNMQHRVNRNWGHYVFGPERSRKTPYDSDDDIMQTINTLGTSSGESYSYVPVNFVTKNKLPKLLIIGDSYVWTLFNHGMWLQSMAPGSQYLYYNHDVYTLSEQGELTPDGTKEKTFLPQVDDFDFIVILNTEPNLAELGGGFIASYYKKLALTNKPPHTLTEK